MGEYNCARKGFEGLGDGFQEGFWEGSFVVEKENTFGSRSGRMRER